MDARKQEKMNKNLQRIVGEILLTHADVPVDVLVTVTRVATSPSLGAAEVWLSIYPVPRAAEIIERLRQQCYEFQGLLNRRLDARVTPRIRFTVDYGADKANAIEERLREIRQGEQPSAGSENNDRP